MAGNGLATSCVPNDDDGIVVEGMSSMGEAPKLLQRVRAEIRVRHYSRRTEEAYVHWIRRYIVFHGRRHPSELGSADVKEFLTWLAVDRHVAASTQNQAFSAVLFMYKDVLRMNIGDIEHASHAKTPIRVPVLLSVDSCVVGPRDVDE